MGNIHYMISEAAKEVGVESHVLRYWEEELEIGIGRTEMGHRYYTEDDIQLFHCIRKLKDEGVLLKELKLLVPELQKAKKFKKQEVVSHSAEKKQELKVHKPQVNMKQVNAKQVNAKQEQGMQEVQSKKIEKSFTQVLEKALQKNNMVLEQDICDLVTESIKKEMTYLLDAKEQLEEDRYRRLDTLLRQQQLQRKEQSKKHVPVFMKQVLGI